MMPRDLGYNRFPRPLSRCACMLYCMSVGGSLLHCCTLFQSIFLPQGAEALNYVQIVKCMNPSVQMTLWLKVLKGEKLGRLVF